MSPDIICVLIVEHDGHAVDDTLARLLEIDGIEFQTTHVSTLADATLVLKNKSFDVALVDLTLPDSTGWSTFVSIHACTPEMPIVLLTDEADAQAGLNAVKKGAQDYLRKGHTTSEQLVRSIRYAIERKKTEVQLKRYHDHLEELVSERTAKLKLTNERFLKEIGERKLAEVRLRAAIEQLKQHDKMQSQFVSNVSHDLKTPLASISYAIDNMLQGVIGPVPDKVRGYLEMISEDCRRLSGTVNDILDMSRIDARTLVLHKTKIPFARFASKIAESIRIQIDAQQQRLTTQFPSASGFVECDAQKMERVVLNIVQNAIKYTPPGGHIRLQLRADDDDILLDVIDDGIGIAPNDLDKVMDRFYRVGEHITGTGLGLALSKEVVGLHDGHLTLISPPPGLEKGTQVTVRLPKCTAPSVITVDDDDEALHMLERHLKAQGYEVTCARNGREALAHIKSADFDFVITDMVMPEMNGIELIAALRTTTGYKDLPILAITGRELPQGHREMLSGFGIPVLAKPWSKSDLYDRMEEALAARKYFGG